MDFLSSAVLLLFIMDPFGNIPVFHGILQGIPRERRLRIIARELAFAYLVLAGFLLAGRPVLAYLGLQQPALGIAGGLILFLIALGMVFPQHGLHAERESKEDPFLVPLAVPMVAGPSAIAVLLLLVSRDPDRWPVWLGALSAAWAVTAAVLLASTFLWECMGRRGVRAIEKLVGMLLIMMAVQMFLDGLKIYLGLG